MTTPTRPDPRRPCERVTDGRCMFNPDTCTPTCHLDWNPEDQPMTDQQTGWDSAEWRCARCGTAVYAKTQDGLIRGIARHKLDCPPTTTRRTP